MLEAIEALGLHHFGLLDLSPEDRINLSNTVSSTLHALAKETPGKVWWNAEAGHPAIARALRIDPTQLGAAYALTPFRLYRDGARHLILAAHPAPRHLGPFDWDWLGIETVIAWDPRTDTAQVFGDPEPQTVGTFANAPNLYGSPREFFTDWLRARAQFFVLWRQSRRGEWAHGATETDLCPGVLALGSIDQIRWRPADMPPDLTTIGIDAASLNRALIRAARIPRAHNAGMRAAA